MMRQDYLFNNSRIVLPEMRTSCSEVAKLFYLIVHIRGKGCSQQLDPLGMLTMSFNINVNRPAFWYPMLLGNEHDTN